MPARQLLLVAVSVGWACGGVWISSASAQMIQAMPAITATAQEPAPYRASPAVGKGTVPFSSDENRDSPPPYSAWQGSLRTGERISAVGKGTVSFSSNENRDSPPFIDSSVLTSGIDAQSPNAAGSGYMANDLGASRLEAPADSRPLDTNGYVERVLTGDDVWTWQLLPNGLLYRQDLASGTESRLVSQWVYIRGQGWYWTPVAGGRMGILRFGTEDNLWPQGWQLDVEGAAFPRLDAGRNMISTDFRVGVPLTTRQGPWEFKFGYTHLSSHLGDLFMLANPDFPRINYVRDSLATGLAVYLNPSLRFYSETSWAFRTDGGAKPWEFQFGADFSPPEPTTTIWGAPFFAINSHLRQENDFGGNLTVQTGIQWRGRAGHLFRLGAQYFNGLSEQGQFYQQFEEQYGVGLWYDF